MIAEKQHADLCKKKNWQNLAIVARSSYVSDLASIIGGAWNDVR